MPISSWKGAVFGTGLLCASTTLGVKSELNSLSDRQSSDEIRRARNQIAKEFGQNDLKSLSETVSAQVAQEYAHLDPKGEVPKDLLSTTVQYFALNKNKFANQDYIVIINFKARSDQYRFFLIDLKTGRVEKYHTTHGYGSDANDDGYAEYFGNIVDSGASSVGFIRTAEVYWGRFQRSLRLDGLSSTNSRIRERAIVVHGWDYVHERSVIQGLTWGCPALDWSLKDGVIDKIKEGSLMYIGASSNP